MPSLPEIPDFPGKGLIGDTSKRVRLVAAGAGLAAAAAGGVVVRKALRRGGGEGADADPIAETPTAPPGSEAKEPPAPKPKPAKAKAPKPKPEKPKPAGPKAPKPKPANSKAPSKPASEPGNISGDAEPHHALNNPVGEPDETEYPDPFEKRDDPRDPVDPDGEPFGEEPHPQTGSESTSEPPASLDPDRVEPPDRDD